MTFLLSQLWPWLLIILLIGVATALWAQAETRRDKIAPWLLWCALAFALGVVLVGLGALQGRPELWLESALAGLVTYFFGAAAGSLFRKNGLAEHDKWALGLIPTALVWLTANLISAPTIETDLAKAAHAKVDTTGAPPPRLVVEGRDVLVPANAPHKEALVAALEKIDGVRRVISAERATGEPASNVAEKIETVDEEAKAAAEKAADEARAAAEKAAEEARRAAEAGKRAAEKVIEEAKSASAPKSAVAPTPAEEPKPAPFDAKARAQTAAADLRSIPASGTLDADACQKALSATLVLDKIQFRTGSATILRASAVVLDRLAALLKRCPGSKVEIGGHTDNVGGDEDNLVLSQRRADSVLKYLRGEGVAASRLSAVGYGAKKPVASNDEEEGRAENRRIELLLK